MTKIVTLAAALAVTAVVNPACVAPARAADETPAVIIEEQSQWEKFKEGAKLAGEAVVQGTKNTAGKVADGAERAGEAIAEKYDDAKAYVHEKTAE